MRALVPWMLLAVGCGADADEPRYGVVHGSLSITDDGVEGYQVWELFSEAWEKDRDRSAHVCASVMAFDGVVVTDGPGCQGCDAVIALAMEPVETDCAQGMESFGEASHYAFGVPPAELQAEASEASLGWYVGWTGDGLEAVGLAEPEEEGGAWEPGQRWSLEASWVYDLSP